MVTRLSSKFIKWESSNVVIINFSAKIIELDTFSGMFITNTVLFDNFEFKMYINYTGNLSETMLACGEKIEMFNRLYNKPREQYVFINDTDNI